MTYTKPEINVLGEAARVIEDTHLKEDPIAFDGDQLSVNPAYDLDE